MWQRQGNAVVFPLPQQLLGGDQAIEITDHVRQLVASGIEHVIFDCSAVELINSSGLGILVAALATLRTRGGRCTLVAVPDKMQSLLEVTHLGSIFTLADSVAAALTE
ncbi:MAG: anti-sigma factor antagonist [Chlorobiota bacterium]|jgi:anti-sigma B factor antagonist|nr:MAG: anti-sigma factor antagonist [Chlorobiota bacterium]